MQRLGQRLSLWWSHYGSLEPHATTRWQRCARAVDTHDFSRSRVQNFPPTQPGSGERLKCSRSSRSSSSSSAAVYVHYCSRSSSGAASADNLYHMTTFLQCVSVWVCECVSVCACVCVCVMHLRGFAMFMSTWPALPCVRFFRTGSIVCARRHDLVAVNWAGATHVWPPAAWPARSRSVGH